MRHGSNNVNLHSIFNLIHLVLELLTLILVDNGKAKITHIVKIHSFLCPFCEVKE